MMAKVMVSQMKEMKKTRMVMGSWSLNKIIILESVSLFVAGKHQSRSILTQTTDVARK